MRKGKGRGGERESERVSEHARVTEDERRETGEEKRRREEGKSGGEEGREINK